MKIIQQVTLYYREGSSDKVYQAQLNSVEGGHTVTFAYGRRGSTLKDGAKTAEPVTLDKAEKIYNKLVSEKVAKGYTRGADGTPFHGTSSMEDSTIRCQLLNTVAESDVIGLLNDSQHCVQEKFDGERRLIERVGGVVRGINRKGLYVVLGDPLANTAAAFPMVGDYTLDGEQIGDVFYAFDLLTHPAKGDVRSLPYSERLLLLSELLRTQWADSALRSVRTAFAPIDKHGLFAEVRGRHGEGVVFKNKCEAYSHGRPSTGGPALKHKFTDSCSVVVGGVNDGKRSVSVTALDNSGRAIELGNVTIPPNHPIPAAGQVVEVRYLYAYRDGSLFQPVYLGVRNDLDASDCVLSQLKYKPDTAA